MLGFVPQPNLRGDAIALAEGSYSPVLSIGEGGITQNSISNSGVIDSSRQINHGLTQVNTSQISSFQGGRTKNSSSDTSISQIGSSQSTFLQVCTTEIGLSQIGIIQPTVSEESTTKISLTQISSFPYRTLKIGVTQIDLTQITITEIDPAQGDSREISFSSSISSEHFFSIHNSTPQTINTLNSIGQNFWNTLLLPSTPLNLTLQITDLPTGQLAEAQITSYDPSGHPNGGTLLIDQDANGLGWYIDPTPLDNSEFNQPLGDTVRSLDRVVRSPLVKLNKYLM